jgi:hypothetical protein
MAVPPEEKATPEWQTKNAAGKAFKAARASWRDAKNRKNQIKAQIDAGGLTATDERALKDELERLKETLPTLAKTRRLTKATWQALKDRYETPPVSGGR